MSYSLDTSQNVWRLTFSGTLTGDDLQKLSEEVEKSEQTSPSAFNRLVDMRQLKGISIGFSEMSDLASRRRRQKFSNNIKSALVTNHPIQYGFARMYQTLLSHPQITVKVFQDETEALNWLSRYDLT